MSALLENIEHILLKSIFNYVYNYMNKKHM